MLVGQSSFSSYKKYLKTNVQLVSLAFLLIVAGAAYCDDSTSQEQSSSVNSSAAGKGYIAVVDPRFDRCTAQDGSYSYHVRNSEPCPHESDSRKPMVVMQSEAYLAAQVENDKIERDLHEFNKRNGETDAEYKARMEASQNSRWLQVQENNARQAAAKTAEESRINENVANQPAKTDSHVMVKTETDSHVMIWLCIFAVLAGPIWWLWRNLVPATPVRATRRTVSQPRPSAILNATRQPAPFREMSPPEPVQSEPSSPLRELTAHQQVEKYLHAFETDGAMPPIAYHAEIKALNLDYSPESLARLDQFLVELRHRIKPSYNDIVENPQLQQLVIFLGMYLATAIARVTQQSIKWYDYDAAKAHLRDPNYPETMGTLMSCMLGKGYHHLPLGLICVTLYEHDSTESCVERLNFYREHADPLIPIPRSSLQAVVNAQNEAEQAWFTALSVAGISAATAMFKIDRGSQLQPTLTVLEPEEKNMQFVVFMDKSTDVAVQEMEQNPRNLPFKVLAYDSYANLPTGRMDAITIHTQCYGEFAATWIIVIPYRHASHPEGFAFYPPLIASSSVAAEYNPMIMHAFYSGVAGMKLPDDPWNHYLQELG